MLITSRHPALIQSRDFAALGLDDARLRDACRRGDLVRVRRGVYVEAGRWAALGVEERCRLTVVAAAATCRTRVVVSHVSAAVVHGLPLVGAPSRWVHVLVPPAGGSRREHGFAKHARDDHDRPDALEVDGVLVTPLDATLVDVCLTEPFVRAVVMTDHALHRGMVTLESLAAEFERRGTRRGAKRVQAVLEFATPSAQGPLESVSRVGFRLLGLPDPVLQHQLFDETGRRVAIVDDRWPGFGVVGESDGRVKYTDPGMTAGRTAAQVLMDEKDREDDIRALPEVRGFARRGWDVALDVRRLGPVLARAGVVPVGPSERATSPSTVDDDRPDSTNPPVPRPPSAPGRVAR